MHTSVDTLERFTQVALVALYGEKEGELSQLRDLIEFCQGQVKDKLGSAFRPYRLEQVHATILGLERCGGATRQNLNFSKRHQSPREVRMDFDGLLRFLRSCPQLPFTAQIAGFTNREYPFVSDPFGTNKVYRPYDRSFSIQGDKVVMMGWPLRGRPWEIAPTKSHELVQESRIYPLNLDEIRYAAQRYGVLHSYHKTATTVDNDLFFRIGLLRSAPDEQTARVLSEDVREHLSEMAPVTVEVTLENIYVAAYESTELPADSTGVWSLADKRVTGQFVAALYDHENLEDLRRPAGERR